MPSIFVKPAPGLNVNDPVYMNSPRELRHLPAEGRLVEKNFYWVKCINNGEVVECDPDTKEPLGPFAVPRMLTRDGVDDGPSVDDSPDTGAAPAPRESVNDAHGDDAA